MTRTITVLQAWIASRIATERGATMVEYGFLIALIATIVAVTAAVFGTALGDLYGTVRASF